MGPPFLTAVEDGEWSASAPATGWVPQPLPVLIAPQAAISARNVKQSEWAAGGWNWLRTGV
jgi:hypothetical protein